VLGDLTYEYDKAGNRTRIGGSFARTGIPQAVSTTLYNAANHQTTFGDKILTYDNNGNLQTVTDSGGTTTYTWNARNQLVGISGLNMNASFIYDGLGRREKKTINGNLAEFLFDGINPVQETSGAAILGNMLPGLGIDEFLTRTDVVAGATSAFLTDALASPVAATDNTGVVQTEYSYEAFGRTTVAGVSNTNPFQYTSRENDGTGLYYYRARYYHPVFQRFIAEDAIEFSALGENLYAFVSNNPLTFIDPLGLAGITLGVGATGAIATYGGTASVGVYLGSGGIGVYGTIGSEGGGALVSCCVTGGYYPGEDPGGSSTNFELGFGYGSLGASFTDGNFTGATAGKFGPSLGFGATNSTTKAICLFFCKNGSKSAS
jgi:RHS repeat-associated protein